MMSRVHRQDYEMARVEKTVKILVCNAGSSRLKFSHFEGLDGRGWHRLLRDRHSSFDAGGSGRFAPIASFRTRMRSTHMD